MYKLIILSAVAFTLMGCASTGTKTATTEIDWNHVNAVERANRSGSVPSRVIWVNPPLKKKTVQELIEERRENRCETQECEVNSRY